MNKRRGLPAYVTLPIFGAFLFATWWFGENSPEAKHAQADLMREAAEASGTPGLRAVRRDAGHKLGQAHADIDFKASGDTNDAVRAVDDRLVKSGWRRVGPEKLYDWGRDLGDHAINYCRGKYRAQLFVWGQAHHAPGGPDFAVDYSWSHGEDPCSAR